MAAHHQFPDNAFDPAEGSQGQRDGFDSPNWNHFDSPPDANTPNTNLPPFLPGFPPAPFPGTQTVTPVPSGSQRQAPGHPTKLDTETLKSGNPTDTPPVSAPARPSRPSSSPETSPTTTTPRPTPTFNPNDSDIYFCGSVPFVPSQYTCYANNVLCPVLNGKRLAPCGESCYDPTIYGCGDGGLEQIHSGRLPNGSPATNTVPLGVTAWPTGIPIPTPKRSFRSTSSSLPTSSSTTSHSSSSSSLTPTSLTPTSLTPTSLTPTSLTPTSSSLSPTTSQPAATNGTVSAAPSDSSLSGNQIAAIAASTSSAVLICAVVVLLLFRRHASKRKLHSQKQVYPEVAFLYDPPVPPPIGTQGLGSSGENSSTSRRSYTVSQGQLPRSEPPSSDSSLRGVGIAEAGASASAAQAVERLKNERRALRHKKSKLRPDPQPLKLAKGLAAGAAGGFGLLPSNGRGSASAPNFESMERNASAPSRVPASSTSLWDEIDIAAGEANLIPSPAMPTHSETQKSTSPLLPPPDLSTPPQALHSPPETSGLSPLALDQQAQGVNENEPFYRRLQQRLSPTRNPTSFSQPRPFPYHAQRGSGSSLLNSPHSSLSPSPSTHSPLSTIDPTPISFPRSTATPFSAMTSISPFTHQGGTGSASTPSPWPPVSGGSSAPARTLPSPITPFGLTTAGATAGTGTARGGPLGTSSSPYPNPYQSYPYTRTGNYTFLQPELYHPPSPKPTPHNSSGSGEMSGLSTLDTRLESGDTWAGEVLGAMGSSSIFGAHGDSDDANFSSSRGWLSSGSAGSPSTSGQPGGFAASRSAQHGSASTSLPRYGSRLQVPSAGLAPDDSGSPQSVQYVPHVHNPESSGDEEMDVGAGTQFGRGIRLGNIAEEMSGGSGSGSEGLLGGAAGGLGMGPGPTTTAGAGGGGNGSDRRRLTVRNEF
ncbi:hypothetical protein IWZ03DRAFT_9460 [Phyllosticta citriasiana]|uniref:Endo-1,3(4)-beta-glucanase 1 carbohydrate binding domain-containing protein n=1 Tax=Phyllosticta citriasiana TaxID=595635 RepID=A0ABR1KXY8_9PEZI